MSNPKSTIEIKKFDHYYIILLDGNFTGGDADEDDADKLKNAIKELASDEGINIILDFKGVKFFASNAMGALVAAYQAVSKNSGKMVMTNVLGYIREAFRITRLDKIFYFCETPEEIIKTLFDGRSADELDEENTIKAIELLKQNIR